MRQIRITTESLGLDTSGIASCALAEDDPVHQEMKAQVFGGLSFAEPMAQQVPLLGTFSNALDKK